MKLKNEKYCGLSFSCNIFAIVILFKSLKLLFDMKFWYKFLFLPILIFALVGCSDDEHESVSLTQYKVEDGKVTQLQKHTIGKGIPIVIMGDRFLDRDITSGEYRKATSWALEGLFSVHPMKSLRDYFDVYEVTAVSYTNKISPGKYTAFASRADSLLTSDYDKAVEYAKKAIGEECIDDATIIILIHHNFNQDYHCSHCTFVTYPSSDSDIPTGCAVACVTLELYENDMIKRDADYKTLLHEAAGHGFAKLADEYVDDGLQWDGPDEADKEWLMEYQSKGYYRNISYDSDVTKSCWAGFAADSRYNFEKLGCYEGAQYIDTGVYRATENSIMRNLDYGFNVAGREMIYKRCMNIAFGDSWKFDYEDFVNFDLKKAKAEYEANQRRNPSFSKSKYFCAPPRFVKMQTSR